MHSECGRFTVTFNGEIYNHLNLRPELEAAGAAPCWSGISDTETLLYAVGFWGIKAALKRFNGMFAFGIWGARERALDLFRDRFGEKPLFYGWMRRRIRVRLRAQGVRPSIRLDNRQSTGERSRRSCATPTCRRPGRSGRASGSSIAVVGHDRLPRERPAPPIRFSPDALVDARRQVRGRTRGRTGSPIVRRPKSWSGCSSQAVKRQMIVRRAAWRFLSGGIDSSTIVALMQAQPPTREGLLRSASAKAFNEAGHARARGAPSRHRTTPS